MDYCDGSKRFGDISTYLVALKAYQTETINTWIFWVGGIFDFRAFAIDIAIYFNLKEKQNWWIIT